MAATVYWPQEVQTRKRLGVVDIFTSDTAPTSREIHVGICVIAAPRGWIVERTDVNNEARRPRHPHTVLVYTQAARGQGLRLEDAGQGAVIAADVDGTALGIPSVVVDNVRVGTLAAQHLLDTGLRSLAYFGQRGHAWADDRLRGFVAHIGNACPTALLDVYHKLDGDSGLVRDEAFGPQNIVPWLQSLPRPAGIFAGCDGWATFLIYNCRLANLRVPEDVAVIGVDNDEYLCQTSSPPLSSVVLPMRRVGIEVGLLIDRLFAGEALPAEAITIVPTRVVARRSTEIVAIDDPSVAEALHFIRRHAHRPLMVSEILRQVPATQRSLERGFRRYLGRTMLEEVRRVRVCHAEQLLAETDLPIERIARQSGFASRCKFFVAFRKETQLTPAQYRAQFRVPGPAPSTPPAMRNLARFGPEPQFAPGVAP